MNRYVAVGIFGDMQAVNKAVARAYGNCFFTNIGIAVLDTGLRQQVEQGLLVEVNKDDLIANGLSVDSAAYCESEVANGRIMLAVKSLVGIDGAESHIRESGGQTPPNV